MKIARAIYRAGAQLEKFKRKNVSQKRRKSPPTARACS